MGGRHGQHLTRCYSFTQGGTRLLAHTGTHLLAQFQIRVDLKVAGIPYRDEAGLVADFHALRHTCGSWLAAAGIHLKVIQGIMRHSTITLTADRYTKLFKNDQAEGIAQLPDLSGDGREVVAATGTNGAESGGENWASGWASRVRKHAILSDSMRQKPSKKREVEHNEKPFISREKPKKQGLKSGEGGIRTHGRANPTLVFETSSFSRSDTSPKAGRVGTARRVGHDNQIGWCLRQLEYRPPVGLPQHPIYR